jgi:DNA modification methylase
MLSILLGDCRETLTALPDASVHCCVTSPPYFGLRDYGHDGQIGLEDTPNAYVAQMVAVFREVRRVLRDDGTLWLNLGDSYAANRTYQVPSTKGGPKHGPGQAAGGNGSVVPDGLKPKDLLGIPWRVAFALQADGWYLRQDIIWHKPNPMPESVTDRCTKAHEYLFLLTKSARYHYDAEAIKEPAEQAGRVRADKMGGNKGDVVNHSPGAVFTGSETRNRRSVWTVTTKPYAGAHFATFPPDLIEPCILAGAPKSCCAKCGAPVERVSGRGATKEVEASSLDRFGDGSAGVHRKVGSAYQKWLNENPVVTTGWRATCTCNAGTVPGTILDPFGGSGTTAGVSLKHGRKAILCELNEDYVSLMSDRIEKISGMDAESWEMV